MHGSVCYLGRAAGVKALAQRPRQGYECADGSEGFVTSMQLGTTLDHRWTLASLLATGTSGEVFRATDSTGGPDVAVKILREEWTDDLVAVQRFQREARATQKINHPHVVKVLGHGLEDRRPWIVMELLHGETLETLAARRSLTLAEVTKVISQIGAAIDVAHAAGVVHRDLKPDNVFVLEATRELTVKVLDFGFAKVADKLTVGGDLTAVNAILGTPLYMSPEQIRSSKTVDRRTDVWSLGVMAYELLAGTPPFKNERVADLFVEILSKPAPPLGIAVSPSSGAALDAWTQRALARRPEDRFATATELADALTDALTPQRKLSPYALAIFIAAAVAFIVLLVTRLSRA